MSCFKAKASYTLATKSTSDSVDRLVDSVDFNKIDRVEVDFVASVYEA